MKKHILQPVLVLAFLAVIGATIYIVPFVLDVVHNSSFKFVSLFLVLILASNILSKIATTYINL